MRQLRSSYSHKCRNRQSQQCLNFLLLFLFVLTHHFTLNSHIILPYHPLDLAPHLPQKISLFVPSSNGIHSLSIKVLLFKDYGVQSKFPLFQLPTSTLHRDITNTQFSNYTVGICFLINKQYFYQKKTLLTKLEYPQMRDGRYKKDEDNLNIIHTGYKRGSKLKENMYKHQKNREDHKLFLLHPGKNEAPYA